jgi:hypothetical protein
MSLNPFSSIGGFLGSAIGDWATQDEREERRRLIERERRMYADLPTNIKAEQEAIDELGPSAYGSIQEDPALRQEQLRTITGLREIADARGLDPQARTALAESQAANAGQERAQRGSILDQFSRRGGGGGNSALLAALTSQQGSVQRAGMEGLRVAGDANARQVQAMRDAGVLAGGVRSQDYGVASDRAGAMDRVSAYNAQNRQTVAGRNADRKQRTSEGNIGRRYQQAGMVGGTYGDERDYLSEEERRKRALWAGGGQAVGAGVGAAIGPGAGGSPFAGASASGSWGGG